jgi:hypothetical protein
MDRLDQYPKSLKKAIRYLKQEASLEQLDEFRKMIDRVIHNRTVRNKVTINS